MQTLNDEESVESTAAVEAENEAAIVSVIVNNIQNDCIVHIGLNHHTYIRSVDRSKKMRRMEIASGDRIHHQYTNDQ